MANELIIQLGAGPTQPRRLLDTIERFTVPDGNPLRWLDGVQWEPNPCRALTVDAEDVCTSDTLDVVPDTCIEFLTQTPFRISDAMERSTLDSTFEEMGQRLVDNYNVRVSAAFAAELVSGTASGGMSLSSEATTPNGNPFASPAVSAQYGLETLEDELAERLQGGVGYLHCPPGVLTRWVAECGVKLNAADQWETPAGNIVISDAGYMRGARPAGGTVSGNGTDWVYASGPVWYQSTSPTVIGEDGGGFKVSGGRTTTAWDRNLMVQYVAGFGILVFDPCPVTAVLIGYNEVGEVWAS